MSQQPSSVRPFETPLGDQEPSTSSEAPSPSLGSDALWAERFAMLEAEKTELKDRALRALAEVENIRRRAEKDVADAKAYGITGFARDMLNAADNLRRALENAPSELQGALADFREGVALTERDLLKTLERHGVRRIEAEGQKFDPNLHQAMFETENLQVPTGTVTQVIQSGYTIGERVLRPALVGVAKGGPKSFAEASTEV